MHIRLRTRHLAVWAALAAWSSAAAQPSRLLQAADSFAAVSAGRPSGAWPDRSDSSRAAIARRIDGIFASLQAVDVSRLTTTADRALYYNVRDAVEASIGARVCRNHLWIISSPFSGWHVIASNTARNLGVGTDSLRAAAAAIFRAAPAALEADRGLLQRGLDSGYTIPRPVIESVIRQFDGLLPPVVDSSPLFAPAIRDGDSAFRLRFRAIIRDTVYPAARAFQDFLRTTYLPRARADGSLGGLPGGRACYAALLHSQTSLKVNLDSVMGEARREVDLLRRRLEPIVLKLTGDREFARGVRHLRTDTSYAIPRDSILRVYRAATARAASRAALVVTGVEPESLVVDSYAAFQERAGLPPQYFRAPVDGSRPAQFLVNLSRSERMSVGTAVAHEAYPGHHLQAILARKATPAHQAMRYVGVGAFSEGWGVYAEELAGDMGLYATPLDSAGLLVHLLDVAIATYLDIAYHAKGWSREQLIDSMMVLGGRPRSQAEVYADRHAATPGQLAVYFIGYREMKHLRSEAERQLGAAFSMKDFHYEVLRDGSMALLSLREKMQRWVDGQRRRTSLIERGRASIVRRHRYDEWS